MAETPEHAESLDRRYGLSGLVVAPIGYLVLLFLPVFLEVASKDLGLSDQQVGQLGSMDSAGLALATLTCALVITRLNFHLVALVGVAVTVGGNLLSIGIDNFVTLCAVRFFTGCGEGLLVAIGISAVGMTRNTDRWFGFYTAVIVLVQILGLLVVVPVYDMWRLPGVFGLMALLYLLPLLVVLRLPKGSGGSLEQWRGTRQAAIPTALLQLTLISVLAFYTCIGGIWAYVSFMGTDTGLALNDVSTSLAIAMGAGFLGALFFAGIGNHAKRYSLLVFSVATMMVCLWLLSGFSGELSYTLILCVFSFFWSVMGARLFSLISEADHSGRYISAAQTVLGIGFALGPYLASLLVTESGYTGVNTLGGVALFLCLSTATPLALRVTRHQPQATENAVAE